MTTTTTRTTLLTLTAGFAFSGSALAALPLTEVTLYRSGVAAFSHEGAIEGDAGFELAFGADDLSDVLKSLVVIDTDADAPPTAAYAPNRSLNAILEEYSINPRQPLMSLLTSLQGEEVRLRTPEGEVTGALFGVESMPSPENGVQRQYVTLLTGGGFRTIDRQQILSVDFLDEDVAAEVRDALGALAKHRDEDQATLDIRFTGQGSRRALATYVHKAPVWKASYRLVLPDGNGEPLLQAWAIVENQTDQDWEDVTLTVAAGQPVSFTMDLQTPFVPYRPAIAPPYAVSMGPQVFERELRMDQRQAMASAPASMDAARRNRAELQSKVGYAEEAMSDMSAIGTPRSPNLGGISEQGSAAGVEAGGQFLFTFDSSVDLERGRSAMLPLATENIDGRRVTVYSSRMRAPMQGVELTNSAAIDLMPGPIAVYDSGSYAGDAQIGHVSRGEDRLLTFAVDQDVLVVQSQKSTGRVANLKIVDGLLIETVIDQRVEDYKTVNRDADEGRVLLIEHPKYSEWKIVGKTQPISESASSYRFEVKLKADDDLALAVVSERERYSRFTLADYSIESLLVHVRNGKASPAVRDAFMNASRMSAEVKGIEKRIAAADARLDEITQDQRRIRDNMGRVGHGSELWARYTKKLAEQENEIESILSSRDELRVSLVQAQGALRDFLRDLDVE